MQPEPRRPTRVTLEAPKVETIFGAIDRIYDHRVTGWAWDRRTPDTPIDVEITLDGETVARGTADRLREDLANNGVGNGRHAFDIRFEHTLPIDSKHRVAAVAVDGKDDRRVTLLNREAPPPPPAVTRDADEPPPVAVTAVPEALGRWLDDFRVVQSSLETALISAVKQVRSSSNSRLVEMAHDSKRVGEALESLQNAQEMFARQLETMEAVQARIDQALVSIRVAETERPRRDAVDRWTKRVVTLLTLTSLTALAFGVYSVFG
jgi:hypothetical protein